MIYIYETRNDDIIIRYDIRSYDIREVPFVARHLSIGYKPKKEVVS
jgi:hypothetical protein